MSTIPDLDIYRSAAVLVREHGEDASQCEVVKSILVLAWVYSAKLPT